MANRVKHIAFERGKDCRNSVVLVTCTETKLYACLNFLQNRGTTYSIGYKSEGFYEFVTLLPWQEAAAFYNEAERRSWMYAKPLRHIADDYCDPEKERYEWQEGRVTRSSLARRTGEVSKALVDGEEERTRNKTGEARK